MDSIVVGVLELFELYPEACTFILISGAVVPAFIFALQALLGIPFSILDLLCYRHSVVLCEARHRGVNTSKCRGRRCPYSRQCPFHLPRRTFRQWWVNVTHSQVAGELGQEQDCVTGGGNEK